MSTITKNTNTVKSETETTYKVDADNLTELQKIARENPDAVLKEARRILTERLKICGDVINSPNTSRDFLHSHLADKKHECFYVMYLNAKHHVIDHHELFRGTIDSCSVPVRELIVESLNRNAAALIIAHNHPSGNPEPSMADRSLTEAIKLAASMVGIKLLDHFVVGAEEIVSLAEIGCIN